MRETEILRYANSKTIYLTPMRTFSGNFWGINTTKMRINRERGRHGIQEPGNPMCGRWREDLGRQLWASRGQLQTGGVKTNPIEHVASARLKRRIRQLARGDKRSKTIINLEKTLKTCTEKQKSWQKKEKWPYFTTWLGCEKRWYNDVNTQWWVNKIRIKFISGDWVLKWYSQGRGEKASKILIAYTAPNWKIKTKT